MKFSANLGMLFAEVPFLERFARARAAGFEGVEYPSPYAFAPAQLAELLRVHELDQVLLNLPCGDFAKGERGIACQPERRGEFRDGVGLGIEYARALGCRSLNCLAGPAPGIAHEVASDTFVENLRFAAAALGDAGIRLLIEPINGRDMPGFHLQTSAQALSVIHAVGSNNLWLQYDVYHMQVMEGDLARGIERCLPHIAHIQIADNPGRHEPGTGEINYAFLLPHIDGLGYTGWIGCEYLPAAGTEQGLGWLLPYRSS
jgi:hydroxypyruvate isomerase